MVDLSHVYCSNFSHFQFVQFVFFQLLESLEWQCALTSHRQEAMAKSYRSPFSGQWDYYYTAHRDSIVKPCVTNTSKAHTLPSTHEQSKALSFRLDLSARFKGSEHGKIHWVKTWWKTELLWIGLCWSTVCINSNVHFPFP